MWLAFHAVSDQAHAIVESCVVLSVGSNASLGICYLDFPNNKLEAAESSSRTGGAMTEHGGERRSKTRPPGLEHGSWDNRRGRIEGRLRGIGMD
jgi:hypothetical protein